MLCHSVRAFVVAVVMGRDINGIRHTEYCKVPLPLVGFYGWGESRALLLEFNFLQGNVHHL